MLLDRSSCICCRYRVGAFRVYGGTLGLDTGRKQASGEWPSLVTLGSFLAEFALESSLLGDRPWNVVLGNCLCVVGFGKSSLGDRPPGLWALSSLLWVIVLCSRLLAVAFDPSKFDGCPVFKSVLLRGCRAAAAPAGETSSRTLLFFSRIDSLLLEKRLLRCKSVSQRLSQRFHAEERRTTP